MGFGKGPMETLVDISRGFIFGAIVMVVVAIPFGFVEMAVTAWGLLMFWIGFYFFSLIVLRRR